MMDTPPIPYQTYKSKRHSRTSSNSHLVPNASLSTVSRPPDSASPVASTIVLPQNHISTPEKTQHLSSNGVSLPPSNGQPPPATNGVSSNSSEYPLHSLSRGESTIPFQLSSSAPDTPIVGGVTNETSKIGAGPSSLPSTPSTQPAELPGQATRKSSTFRRIPPRSSRPTPTSSPLRPFESHSRTTSTSSTSWLSEPPRTHVPAEARTRITSLSSVASEVSGKKPLPPIFLETPISPPRVSPTSSQQHLLLSGEILSPPHRSSSLAPKTPTKVLSPPSITPTSSTSTTSPESLTTRSATNHRSSAPYRPGFQPRGVYQPRTEEFINFRNSARDVGRIERTKLERRLEKLIDLHFSPDVKKAAQPPVNRRASSFFDFDLSDLKTIDPSELWKGMLQSQTFQVGTKSDIRVAEQRITPWQDDASVSKCPLCLASFQPLSNRKHHCRLCGQIICSLPVKHPQRPVSCSLLFVVDPKTKQIEEVGEGVDYGVRKRPSSAPQGKGKGREDELPEDEKFLKGVRICRECRPVLLRQRYRYEIHHVPTFVKLYEAFVTLEKEIEDSLPQFQELILSLSNEGQPTKEASAARKRLLEAFSQYDALSKRIRQLPCTGGMGSSQYRIQMAIHTRANLFLQQNMFPLQSLPRAQKTIGKSASSEEERTIDPDSEMAHTLQPLLEQEALLESFVEEAQSRRKFEDAKTLKANLVEIRAEIDRIFASAENGTARR